jgi:hypothetical protein
MLRSFSYRHKTENNLLPFHQCYPHLIMALGFEYSWDSESYADGSVATGRATQAGQVEG